MCTGPFVALAFVSRYSSRKWSWISKQLAQATAESSTHLPVLAPLTARSESTEELELSKKSLVATKNGTLVAIVFGVIASLGILAKIFQIYRRRRVRPSCDVEGQQAIFTPTMMGPILAAAMLPTLPRAPALDVTHYVPTGLAAISEEGPGTAIPEGPRRIEPETIAKTKHIRDDVDLEAVPNSHTTGNLDISGWRLSNTGFTPDISSPGIDLTRFGGLQSESSVITSRRVLRPDDLKVKHNAAPMVGIVVCINHTNERASGHVVIDYGAEH